MRARRLLPWLAMALLVGGALVVGPRGAGRRSATERARDIAAGVRCPTCGGESALESDAPISKAIRAEIGRRVTAGQSDARIREYLVSRYGPSILLRPATSGVTGLVWVLPLVAFAIAAVAVGAAIPRWRARARTARPSDDDRALVDRALGERARGTGPARSRDPGVDLDALAGLEEQRAYLLRSLADLDRERGTGELDQATYAALRDDATTRAASLLREIERARTALPRPSSTRPRGRRAPAVAVGMAVLAGASLLVLGAIRPRHAGGVSSGSIGLNATDRLAEAKRLAQDGKAAEALERYEQVLAADPSQPEALSYRGLLLVMGGQTEVGLASVERAIAVDPTYPDAHFIRGLVLGQQGDRATAAAEFRAVLADDPPPELASAARDALREVLAAAPAAAPAASPAASPTR